MNQLPLMMGNDLENKNQISNKSNNSNINLMNNQQNKIQEKYKGINQIMGEKIIKKTNLNQNDEIIKEAHIDGHLYSMSLQTMKFFCQQMETSICKFKKPNNIFGTGFICKIKNKNNLYEIPVLITCNHVLNENDLTIGNEINLVFNNTKYIKLKINKIRKIYTNSRYDITIIELKKNDNFNENEMLEIDENIFQVDYNYYIKRQIYIIHIPNGTEIRYSSEVIRSIDLTGKIEHFCSTESGSSGAPIINFETRKVIGLHIGYNANKKVNLGTLLNNPIEEFFKMYMLHQNKKNEIIITLEIKNEDLNKNIYFLDNIDYSDDLVGKNNPENSLLELNDSNLKVYINDNKFDYARYFNPEKEGKYTIKLEIGINMKDCTQMFYGCYNITYLDLSNFNTENVTSMKYMFSGCKNLKNINLSAFNTENVTNMSYMFYECLKLEKIYLSTFNTENVTDMSGMFCAVNINKLNLSYLNTKNVTNMSHMFYRCEKITNLDLSNFDTGNVKDLSGFFGGCINLNNVDLSSFNTKNVFYMSHLFYGCQNLTNVSLTNFDTRNVDNMNSMFYRCYNLRTVDLSSFNTKNVINMGAMFRDCKRLVNLDLSSFNTSNVIYMYDMFSGCESLYNLDISNFDCSNKKKINMGPFSSPIAVIFGNPNTNMFQKCYSLTNIIISYKDSKNKDFMLDLGNNAKALQNIKVKVKY